MAKKKVGDVLEDIFGARDAGEPTHRPRWVSYWTHGVAEVGVDVELAELAGPPLSITL